jgi:hypothetical protein
MNNFWQPITIFKVLALKKSLIFDKALLFLLFYTYPFPFLLTVPRFQRILTLPGFAIFTPADRIRRLRWIDWMLFGRFGRSHSSASFARSFCSLLANFLGILCGLEFICVGDLFVGKLFAIWVWIWAVFYLICFCMCKSFLLIKISRI